MIVLLGSPVLLAAGGDISSSQVLADRALRIHSEVGESAAIDFLSGLGGRYVAIVATPSKLSLVPDCHATLATYFTGADDRVVLGSHSSLVAAVSGMPTSEHALGIVNSDEYIEPGGKYYPALLTPYEEVLPVFANCIFTYRSGGGIEHERFYPRQPLPEFSSLDAAYAEFRDLLGRHVRALTRKERAVISLTAGLDSRAALAASLDWLRAVDAVATTYIRFEPLAATNVNDALVANRIAERVGLRHRIIPIDPVDPESAEAKAYNRTFPKGARFPALTQAYMRHVGADETNIISTISETGTMFYKERDDPWPTSERLASKFTTSPLGRNPVVVQEFQRYIDFTQFRLENFYDIDYHDLFYWEHRNSKWANIWYAEADLSHSVALPFNHRRIVEIMLSLSPELRRDRYLLNRLIEDSGLTL